MPESTAVEQLQDAARRADLGAFTKALEGIDWFAHQPEDLIYAIDLALSIGALPAARQLSQNGAMRFRDNPVLQIYAKVLAPPKVLRTNLPSKPEARANTHWLKEHSSEHRGEWVALRSGELLESAGSLDQLVSNLSTKNGVLFIRIQ